MFKGCSQVSIGAGHKGSTQQNSFDQVRERKQKGRQTMVSREEETENNASAQTEVCLVELGAHFA